MKYSGVALYSPEEYGMLKKDYFKKTFFAEIGGKKIGCGYYKISLKDIEKNIGENPDLRIGRKDFRVFEYKDGKMKFRNFYQLTPGMHFYSLKHFYQNIDFYKKKYADLRDDIVVNFKTKIFGFERLRYCNSQMDYTMPFALYKPKNLKEKIPLVIFLHGYTNGGERNLVPFTECLHFTNKIKRNIKKNPCMMLVPSIPKYAGYFTPADGSDNAGFEGNFNGLFNKLIREYPIDENRIYIVGSSNGAGGTWSQLRLHPERYAAAIPMMGWSDVITDDYFESIKDVAVWAVHAEDDKNVRIGEMGNGYYGSDYLVEGLKKSGSLKVKYSRYIKHGHTASRFFLHHEDWYSWLFNQTK